MPLERISGFLRATVIVSEDARFCHHHGVDWGALREVVDRPGANGPTRGASTIPMQTAKNLLLWPSRSYVRKAIEIPLALLIDLAWSKRRILEVYLNLAEWGKGVFGVEAAARHYFHKSADRLDAREAALLATSLPNPSHRNAGRPSRRHLWLAARVMAKAQRAGLLSNALNEVSMIRLAGSASRPLPHILGWSSMGFHCKRHVNHAATRCGFARARADIETATWLFRNAKRPR